MQSSISPHFSKLEIGLLLAIIIGFVVAYTINNGMYKQTKQEILIMPSVQPSPTGITSPIRPTITQSQTSIGQCTKTSDCGAQRICEEGLCVKVPAPEITKTTTLLQCPTGLVRVCKAGICECLA